MWEMNSYRDFLSENSGRHNVVGSGLVIVIVAALLLVLCAWGGLRSLKCL